MPSLAADAAPMVGPGELKTLGQLSLPAAPATVALWQRILACIVRNLREAERVIRSDAGRVSYRAKRKWFTRDDHPRRPHEESISSALVKEMERLRRATFSNCLETFNLCFAAEVERDQEHGIGPASKKIDIRVYNWGRDDDAFDLRIEAKVVHRAQGLTAYAGREGMERFFDEEEPYTVSRLGGMAAYALTDDIAYWTERIGDVAVGHARIGETTLVSLSPDLAPVLMSTVVPHPASRLQLALLIHVVLEFDMDPAGR